MIARELSKNSKRLISNKTLGQPESESSSDSDSSNESEEGSIFGPEKWDSASKSSSSYVASEESDHDQGSDSSSRRRNNIINEHLNELVESEEESCASFHDDSSYESDDDDDLMPELYDSSDGSDIENGSYPDSDNDIGPIWTLEDLSQPQFRKNRFLPSNFPKFSPIFPPGPINIPPGTASPIDFLRLYFNSDLLEIFVENTNQFGSKIIVPIKKNSKSPHKGSWRPTTPSEIFRLFGVLLHMGMKRQPSMRSYWSNDARFSDAFVKRAFTRDRFEILKKCLHVVNPSELNSNELKQMQKDDPFWRVTPFVEHLSNMYQRYFACDQNFDIDEMCIGFKGRHVARCYNPSKPEKWHLKAFCLNDSSSGYLHHFYMYQGFIF